MTAMIDTSMSHQQDAAGNLEQGSAGPQVPVADWAVVGFALVVLGAVAGRPSTRLDFLSAPLIGLGAVFVLLAAFVAWRKPGTIAAFAESRPTTAWLLPRLVAFGVALAVIAGTLSSPHPIVAPCPLDQDHEAVGELIHTRLAGDVIVCTYEDLSNRL